MNDESLARANAFLAAVAARVRPGETLDVSPTVVGREAGIEQPLAAARAVRALLARRRLEAEGDGYRLVDARPVEPGEPESVQRPPRRKKGKAAPRKRPAATPTYSDVGHVAIDRLIELGSEVATLRATARSAKEEAREARAAEDDATRRAQALVERVRELESKLEMAEQNMRTLLVAAKGSGQSDALAGDGDMEAILGVLKGERQPADAPQ